MRLVSAGVRESLIGSAEQAHRTLGARLVELGDHGALAYQVGGQRLVEVEHRLEAAVVLGRERAPLLARALHEDALDLAVGGRARGLELLLDQVLPAHAAAPRGPELRLQRAQRHPAVGAGVGAVADEPPRELELAPVRGLLLGEEARRHHGQPAQCPVGHGDVDELALARAVALA